MTVPQTATVSSHAMTLRRNKVIIGAINGWNPSQTLAITDVFQLGSTSLSGNFDSKSYGVPYEKVPGNIGGQTVQVQRYDLYQNLMEQAFGETAPVEGLQKAGRPTNTALDMLSNQLSPDEMTEGWREPGSGLGQGPTASYQVVYRGLWISNLSRSYSANDQRVVNVNATMEYTVREIVA